MYTYKLNNTFLKTMPSAFFTFTFFFFLFFFISFFHWETSQFLGGGTTDTGMIPGHINVGTELKCVNDGGVVKGDRR